MYSYFSSRLDRQWQASTTCIVISFRARSALSSRGVLIRAEIFAKLDASHLKQLAKISYSDIVFTKCIRLIATRNNYTSCPRRGRLWQLVGVDDERYRRITAGACISSIIKMNTFMNLIVGRSCDNIIYKRLFRMFICVSVSAGCICFTWNNQPAALSA